MGLGEEVPTLDWKARALKAEDELAQWHGVQFVDRLLDSLGAHAETVAAAVERAEKAEVELEQIKKNNVDFWISHNPTMTKVDPAMVMAMIYGPWSESTKDEPPYTHTYDLSVPASWELMDTWPKESRLMNWLRKPHWFKFMRQPKEN